MKNRILILLSLVIISQSVLARDTKHLFSIQDALASPAYDGRLNEDIKLYFGNQGHDQISKNLGDFVTNRKTNGFGKSDQKACEWALLSALLVLQERAVAEGGNAIVNIRSFYKKNEWSSDAQYECHAGAIMAGVALKGTVVRIGK
jgi:uncharacterized protein YbjQ (UPF0145 family)